MSESPTASPRVAIIGAGMSGICMGVTLLGAGIESFTIYEQAGEVGGTWRDNTYPGLYCDVPSRYYSYSFQPNAEWSRLMPPGPEIQKYFRHVAVERNVLPHIRFHTDVIAARYDDGTWWIATADGEEQFDVLVLATGILRVPRYPDIPGKDTFAGPAFHSSRWDHSVALGDKRIGLIGTGSTGVQIVSALGGNVRQLTVFQRSAQWVLPWVNAHYGPWTKAAIRRWPVLGAAGYRFWGGFVRKVIGPAPVRPGFQRWLFANMARWNLRFAVRDPQLRATLTPTDQPLCRRGILGPRYYRAIQNSGVDVVTDAIDHIEPRGVVTADGMLHELDVLVYATGFDARAYAQPMTVLGESGRSLAGEWATGARAYRSVAVPNFPNMFLMLGPHSPVGNQSLVPIAEDQARYALWWIQQIRDGRIKAVAPTDIATDRYNDEIRAAMPNTTWVAGCNSWYLGTDGIPELFPWVPDRHTELLREPVVSDFDVRTV
ncbi:putative monooxygenase [Mycobacterium antarcticum]|uniref:flavin-containing monooxygenase n=1 Tax=Mycolicibacterium sp. TUM20985 TaxID=3023370 RepID=UPI0025727AF5|nr:NAD(P)/FAD-dependent oxidoreductase [Mycolicibacterium sp. TUM20985]BDX33666.1 putative monooxygenase [Mycolicibacterium sp. TUM20985]